MLAPLKWINRYTKTDLPVEDLVRKMIMSGTGVESAQELGADISGVVVGRIQTITKHPNADTLSICIVDVGGEKPLQICTGATNVVEGALVPVAIHGACLAEGLRIKSTKMRGEASEGMLCSYQELGLPHEIYPSACEDGILLFEEDYAPGTDVKTIFGLDDTIIEFEILANRPDCQSVVGVSREVAAVLNQPFRERDHSIKGIGGDVNDYIKITVENPELCPRFCGKIVKNVKIGLSPQWMRNALHAVGIRPINNIVDITNYVMIECGQPLHAYDLTDIHGAHIIVRNAEPGETMHTLDGKERQLEERMLVIADESGATGIAGVMGGENSEIKPDTTTVFLEAASFDTASVRITAKKLGMHTAASGLFSKGVRPQMVLKNIERAAHLIEQLGAGEIVDGTVDVYPSPKQSPEIKADIEYLYSLMGVRMPPEQMLKILARLNIKASHKGDHLICVGPDYRGDLNCAADIAEEVLRFYGYDKLPSELFVARTTAGATSEKHAFQYHVRDLMCGAGLMEIYTFSYISPKAYDMIALPADDPRRSSAQLTNPLGEDYSLMRTTLLPSMLQTLSLNHARKNPDVMLYEIAPVFLPKQIPITELVDEVPTLCLGMYGDGMDFYSLKGLVELIMDEYGVQVQVQRAAESYLHPGRSAVATAAKEAKETVATFGQLHPSVCEAYRLPAGTYVAEINLRLVQKLASPLQEAAPPPRYPAVTRDIALVMEDAVFAGDCLATIQKACGKLFESAQVFDVYRGKGIEEGKKSVAFSFTLRAQDRTLTDEETTRVFQKVLSACEREHSAALRS